MSSLHNADQQGEQINHISLKKPSYAPSAALRAYLADFERATPLPCHYTDLLRYTHSMPQLDKQANYTLWQSVYYHEIDRMELFPALTLIYALLKNAGDVSVMEHLRVDRVDYCTFGNSNPFRVKIINTFNDNYDYFYVKNADASRIYGLELEHILSPNRISYMAERGTLVEEHIAGIPGDRFITAYLDTHNVNETRIAKEFVKFNERCFVKLLGDMRAYNFVVDITPDFDDTQYRIRAIDFDQQCYEGRRSIYLPQFFKENNAYVQLCIKRLNAETVRQYQSEEQSLIAARIRTSRYRLKALLDSMEHELLSSHSKVAQLRTELAQHYHSNLFDNCQTMGQIVKNSLRLVLQKH